MGLSAQEQAFAAEVDRCRAAARVTQDWVGQRVGLSRSKVSEVCSGHFLPSRPVLDALITALAMDRERAITLWLAARQGQDARRSAEKSSRHPRPAGWTALPAVPDTVTSLLRAVVEAAHSLPYRLPGARKPSLATVYVRQNLAAGVEEQPTQQYPASDLDGQQVAGTGAAPPIRQTVRPPARTLVDALDDDDHLLITGGPGQGKSTLSLRLSAEVAACWLAAPGQRPPPLAEPVVAIRLTARELAARLDLPLPQALAGAIQAEYGSLLRADVDSGLLAGRVGGCRWLLLVDGLDEVAGESERDRLIAVLAACTANAVGSPYRVVLTTRPIGGAALAPLHRIGAGRYELQPFDQRALEQFADSWFDGDGQNSAYRFLRQVQAAHLDELVRVPLLATIAAIIFEQYGRSPLPDNRYELYEAYLKYLRLAHRDNATNPFRELRERLLEHLGRVRVLADTSLVAAAHAWVVEKIGPGNRSPTWRDDLTDYLAAIGPLTRRGEDLQFLHHSFAEHLAATAEARLLPERFEPTGPEFVPMLHLGRFNDRGRQARSVLLHYTQLRPEQANPVVRCLLAGDADQHVLAARLLAQHVPATTEVVEAFLETARAWAMTTQYPGSVVMDHASRVVHHPGLATWLAGLMRDATAPLPTRVEAAATLATRLRGACTEEALASLREVVDNSGTAVESRLAAAEALVEVGGVEQQTAKNGLRALLTDPTAGLWQFRDTAVVLAGLGTAARTRAVDALVERMADPAMPEDERVAAATGLIEIGTEYHERCAAVLLDALRAWRRSNFVPRKAGPALASLGPRHEEQAITCLRHTMHDPHRSIYERLFAAEALAALGPRHRLEVGTHLSALATEPQDADHRGMIASWLTRIGPQFQQQAVDLCRSVLHEQPSKLYARLQAAQALAELSTNHHAEVAEALTGMLADSLTDPRTQVSAAVRLAALGEPHRTAAVGQLRAYLTDRTCDVAVRCAAADELATLGPEFHREVAALLPAIATGRAAVWDRARAWRTLARLDTSLWGSATAALLELVAEPTPWDTYSGFAVPLTPAQVDNVRRMDDTLLAVLSDPLRSGQRRAQAANGLINLGYRNHCAATDGVIDLVRSDDVTWKHAELWAQTIDRVSLHHRRRIATALQATAIGANRLGTSLCQVVRAVEALGCEVDPRLVTALRGVVADPLADVDEHADALIAIARHEPVELTPAVDAVMGNAARTRDAWRWSRSLSALAALGAEVGRQLHALLARPDLPYDVRESAASHMIRFTPCFAGDAAAELRAQAGDEFLPFTGRTEAMIGLATGDGTHLAEAISFHRAVLDDDGATAAERAKAAHQLAELDRSCAPTALRMLRWLATSPEFTLEENASAVDWLSRLLPFGSPEHDRAAMAIARHPAASPSTRRRLAFCVSETARAEIERSLLEDPTCSIAQRTPWLLGPWWFDALPLQGVEQVFRDALAGAESTPSERAAAAAALGKVSPQGESEAAETLELMCAEALVRPHAQHELIGMGGARRARVLTDALQVVEDRDRPLRERTRAAHLIQRNVAVLPQPVLDHLRSAAQDRRSAAANRLDAHYAIREHDGLDAVRAFRDDPHASAAMRWTAATRLRAHTAQDRAAGARALQAIATDPGCRPAQRWRAARDLMGFGERGRDMGTTALLTMSDDASFPALARACAARALGAERLNHRSQCIRLLRTLAAAEPPLRRLQVLDALGHFEPEEAVLAVLAMTRSQPLSPVERLRSAELVADLHRDRRGSAASLVSSLAQDPTVPVHVRARGAQCLARWSEAHRDEARTLLTDLGWARSPMAGQADRSRSGDPQQNPNTP